MITPEQNARLKEYFPVKAHEFLNGATYLSEEAITDRLDEVDPSWEFHRLGEFAYREGFVIATFRMTVCGVSRDGVGMWDLKMKKKDGTIIDAVDPEKSVSTDALKRAARLFGIGRYILEMGKAVTDYRSLEQWLAQKRRIDASTGEITLVSENGSNSQIKATSNDLAQAAGDYERTPQQVLNGNGAPAKGEKKRMGEQPPVEGDTRDFQVTSVKVVFKDGSPRYALNATNNAVIWAYSRDVFRGLGYPESVIEDWGAKEQTIKFEQKMPISAEWKLYKTGNGGGYWSAVTQEVSEPAVSTEPF
jgi:hypothetical protein